jgi:hypothetical protein
MQVCHGKKGPLQRVQPGDGVVYYSPTELFRGPGKLQAFTAIGRVRDGLPYPIDMGGGFVPYRRDVDWFEAEERTILPLLDKLEFSAGRRNWGYQFRFGLLSIGAADFAEIGRAMGVTGDQAPNPACPLQRNLQSEAEAPRPVP